MSLIDLDMWHNAYQAFLFHLLEKAVPDPDPHARIPLLTPEAMEVWDQAMVTELFSPEFNYERLEKIGDSVLELAFLEYLNTRIKDATAQELSELRNHYLGKIPLAEISRELGFGNWILVDPRLHINANEYVNLLEDVFESFVGALFEIGNKYVSKGTGGRMGYDLVYNFVTSIFNDRDLDLGVVRGNEKTQVTQLMHRLTKEQPVQEDIYRDKPQMAVTIEPTEYLRNILRRNNLPDNELGRAYGKADKGAEIRKTAAERAIDLLQMWDFVKVSEPESTTRRDLFKDDSKVAVQITIPPDLAFLLSRENFRIPKVLATGYGPTKKVAEVQAYQQALKTLTRSGLTLDWIKKFQANREFMIPDLVPFSLQIERKRDADGFKELSFYNPRNTVTADTTILQLRGVTRDNKYVPLITRRIRSENLIPAKIEMVKEYIQSKK